MDITINFTIQYDISNKKIDDIVDDNRKFLLFSKSLVEQCVYVIMTTCINSYIYRNI